MILYLSTANCDSIKHLNFDRINGQHVRGNHGFAFISGSKS